MTEKIVASLTDVSHYYGAVAALDDVSLSIPAGCMAGLIGPDGVGKSTLLALLSGVRRVQTGDIHTLGGDIRKRYHRNRCLKRIAYMPQGLGKNLYPTLSVFENLDFFARLFGHAEKERLARIDTLLRATHLDPFADRPVAKLSGGMKQKLGLCCALIHDPDLLILDEPTTGVDPLSRRQFWELIDSIRNRLPGMSVLVATAYMEEAERFDWLAAMDDGKIIASGSPEEIKLQSGQTTLEAAFIALLPKEKQADHIDINLTPRQDDANNILAIEANNLTCRFGDFTAVDHVSFQIEKGEIFGFLGSNGCGKTTTMKMLTGLLPATEGDASLFGQQLDGNNLETRRRVGYMSQSFSLYSELTVRQNLELHARLYHLPANQIAPRIEEMLNAFDLKSMADIQPNNLPLGIRQRLQLATAVIHRPEILILDEPTSGVDPIARDQFWFYLIDLSRNQGVTIFISTHLMNEAERCDRISLMHAGKVLAVGKPSRLIEERQTTTLEDAFIAWLKEAVNDNSDVISNTEAQVDGYSPDTNVFVTYPKNHNKYSYFDLRRLWAYTRRETMELQRDPIRLIFALLSPLFIMLTFGYGVSLDVEDLPYAVYDQDQSLESRTFLENFNSSRYFVERPPALSIEELDKRLENGELELGIEIPADFGKDLMQNAKPEIGIWIDGSMAFRAETARGYVTGLSQTYLKNQIQQGNIKIPAILPVNIETRFLYNQSFESVYAILPGVVMLMLVLIPAMMTAVGVVREIETGSITNFRATPVTRLEFLVGKQIPYIIIALVSFASMLIMILFVFDMSVKGSFIALVTGATLYVIASTGFGLFVSSFTKSQIAALFVTSVISIVPAIHFSGLLVPVSSLSGAGLFTGLSFPSAWFQQISVGTFTKSLGFEFLWHNHLVLAGFAIIFILAAVISLSKQEK